jgi:hypothetical protein
MSLNVDVDKQATPRNIRRVTVDPKKPLAHTPREMFAQAIARGIDVETAYRQAGYKGNRDSRGSLRRAPDVEARVNCLLQERINADTRARHRREKPIADLKTKVVRELERLAFSDARDVVQWGREAVVDRNGNVTGFEERVSPTPSRNLSAAAAAAVKGVTTKAGSLKVELHDKLQALDKLAKILGLMQDATPSSVTVNQVNVSQGNDTALEAARRLAFAIEAARVAGQLAAPAKTIEGEAITLGDTPKD